MATLPSSVSVVPAADPYSVNATLPVGQQPFGVAVDEAASLVFVTNTGSNNVSVLSSATDLPVGSVPVGALPMGVAYDPTDNEVFVANEGSNNVSVIDVATLTVVATVAVGYSPIGVAYDAATGRVFVANHDSYTVSAIAVATDSVVATVEVGIGPYGVALDNLSDEVYVTNEGSSNVSVLDASSGTSLASIPVLTAWGADLQGVAFDAATGQFWVGAGFAYLIVLNSTARSVAYVYSTDPSGVAYDPDSGTVCVTNADNSTFECLLPSVTRTNTVPLTFAESGLPNGTAWTVAAADGPGLTGIASELTLYICPSYACPSGGSFEFLVSATAGYLASTPVLRVDAQSGSQTFNISFTAGPTEYPIDLFQYGLPPGLGWSVELNGSLAQSIGNALEFLEPNGTYNFTVAPVPGYLANPSEGWVRVDGASTNATILFSVVEFSIWFVESGLPIGAVWYVNFTSGPTGFPLPTSGPLTTNTAYLALPNGSYTYAASAADPSVLNPGPGSFEEVGGTPAELSVVFTPVSYGVSFQEVGLPPATNWAVAMGGTLENSTSAVLDFSATSGTYPFEVSPVYGYRANPDSGNVTVNKTSPLPILITFLSNYTYAVTFHEAGLPAGTGWSVAIGSQFESSLTSNVTLVEPNGTYGYVVLAVPGFKTTYSGAVTVAGRSVDVMVPFTADTFPVIVVEFGLPNGTNWSVTIANSSTGFSVTESTQGSALIFDLPNGTYAVFVLVPPGFQATVSATSFTVAGSVGATPTVHFSSTTAEPTSGATGSTPAYVVPLVGALGVAVVGMGALLAWRWRRPPPPRAP